MIKIKQLVRMVKDRSGATAIEYALIAGVICLAVVAGLTAIGTKTNDTFTTLNEQAFRS
ncbi:MAG: Flp family type IVb pilin [Alphaproteobacteria bacterium]|nr:MAG: Flp family type IVb pilin [Alphaproteobacteria bacterium]